MAFTIRIEPSGHSFTVEPDEKILEAALRQGITLPYSCRDGACGTCKATLRQGQVNYGEYQEKALSPAERAAGKLLLCQARALSDVTVQVRELVTPPGIVIKTLAARVMKMERVAHDVMSLSLKLPQGQRLAFLAGQYIEILLKDHQHRSFSLANPPPLNEIPGDELLELHVRHVPGGSFTDHVFNKMQERDLLRFRGPLGTFFLREESVRPIIFVAGGTGFAPIKAIIEHALAKHVRRPMQLYWGVRAQRDLYRHDLAQSWAQARPHIQYTPVLSESAAQDAWQGRTGFVHEAVAADHADLSGYDVYASGPPPMIEAIQRTFFACGLAPDNLFYDSFEFSHAQ